MNVRTHERGKRFSPQIRGRQQELERAGKDYTRDFCPVWKQSLILPPDFGLRAEPFAALTHGQSSVFQEEERSKSRHDLSLLTTD
jgi:hypothetical protein